MYPTHTVWGSYFHYSITHLADEIRKKKKTKKYCAHIFHIERIVKSTNGLGIFLYQTAYVTTEED